jgi:YfiH family protein
MHVGDSVDDVARNRALLDGLMPANPAWLSQVHGVEVVDASTVANAPEADASIATQPGIVCAIMTADCLPVLFCDTAGQVVGAAHAGWRGLAGGILEKTVARMRSAGATDIIAWLGPAIGPQAFEVGDDVVSAFVRRNPVMRSAFVPISSKPGKHLADIYSLARMVLNDAGIHKIYGGNFCTVTDVTRFYSYRRDGVTGRMASAIWLT